MSVIKKSPWRVAEIAARMFRLDNGRENWAVIVDEAKSAWLRLCADLGAPSRAHFDGSVGKTHR